MLLILFSITTIGSFHVDNYGFRHTFDNISLALHYVATQLNEHYESQSEDYINLKYKWCSLLDANPNSLEMNVN